MTRFGLRARLILLSLLTAPGCGPPEPGAPDLLLVSVDSLRADRLGCYGGPPELGGAICSLGDRGARFVWAFTPASTGGAAAASIHSSLHPSRHGVTDSPASFLSSSFTTLAEELRAAGYRTAAVVSGPELSRSRNLHQGFQLYDDRLPRGAGGGPTRNAEATIDAALSWAGRSARPRFLWVHFGDLHSPFAPPSIPNYEDYEERYRSAIREVDAQLERLIRGLSEPGPPPGVLLTATHGEAIGEDGAWFTHGHSVGMEQIRVPLLWRPPSGDEPHVLSEPVSTLDIAPALLQAARREIPAGFEGEALPLADDPPSTHGMPRALFAEHADQVAVILGRLYYVRHPSAGSPGRFALLEQSGKLPATRPALSTSGVEHLEKALGEFLEFGLPRPGEHRAMGREPSITPQP
jgi:arylsulfatase A-like enzyme